MSVKCDECGNHINCRVGMSNRDIQPLKFACPKCSSLIGLTFEVKGGLGLDLQAIKAILRSKSPKDVKINQGVSHKITGAKEIPALGPFDAKSDFVDLHLDFPVQFGKYVMGQTPFLEAASRASAEKAQFHRDRLQIINTQYKKYPRVSSLIDMYGKGLYGPFRKSARDHFNISTKSNKLEDITAALYRVVSLHVLPFTLPDNSLKSIYYFTQTVVDLSETSKQALIEFMNELVATEFLSHLQRDCLKLYKPIFRAELPMRPALFLDVDKSYAGGSTAMRVSSQDFDEYRDLYKDLSEVVSRQLVLVAGINNLKKRGNHNDFLKGVRVSKAGKEMSPASLDDYANVTLGNKFLDLDDPWHSVSSSAIDHELRNAIAHNKIDYDERTQTITYYPKLEGMTREKRCDIQLLDYMWRILVLFREFHRLHHLVKCLNYATLVGPIASEIGTTDEG